MKDHWGKIWGNREEIKEKEPEQIISIPISSIVSNPYQPRKHFEKEKIEELAQSINTYGLLQPIILKKAMTVIKLQLEKGVSWRVLF